MTISPKDTLSRENLLDFPARFPIKVIGGSGASFRQRVLELITVHAPGLSDEAVTAQVSRNGTYTSLTVTIEAHSRAQLDAIYRDLTACELVVMAL